MTTGGAERGAPDISFIMPCYNEQEVIGYTVPKFVSAFRGAGCQLELIAAERVGAVRDEGRLADLPLVSGAPEML